MFMFCYVVGGMQCIVGGMQCIFGDMQCIVGDMPLVACSASLLSWGKAATEADLGQGCQSAYIVAEQNAWKVLSEDLNRLIGSRQRDSCGYHSNKSSWRIRLDS